MLSTFCCAPLNSVGVHSGCSSVIQNESGPPEARFQVLLGSRADFGDRWFATMIQRVLFRDSVPCWCILRSSLHLLDHKLAHPRGSSRDHPACSSCGQLPHTHALGTHCGPLCPQRPLMWSLETGQKQVSPNQYNFQMNLLVSCQVDNFLFPHFT